MFFYFYSNFVLSVFDMYNIQTERNHIKIESQSVNQPDSVGVQNQVYLEFIEMLCCLDMEAKIVFQTFFFVHTLLIQTHLLVWNSFSYAMNLSHTKNKHNIYGWPVPHNFIAFCWSYEIFVLCFI